MNPPRLERAVGLFVLGGIACLAYFSFEFGSQSLGNGESIVAVARFANIAGLSEGAPVMIAGVPVGSVGKLTLGTDFSAQVELKLRKIWGSHRILSHRFEARVCLVTNMWPFRPAAQMIT